MPSYARNIGGTLAGAVTLTIFSAGLTWGADAPAASPLKSDAAKSLQGVLQRAADQGFVALKDKPDLGELEDKAMAVEVPENDEPRADTVVTNCANTTVLNLDIYKAVDTYDSIAASKSSISSKTEINGVISLIKTYMALGLGSEISNLVSAIEGPKARLLEAIGRSIDGLPTKDDLKLLSSYAQCGSRAQLFSLLAKASSGELGARGPDSQFGRENIQDLENLPPRLRTLMSLKIGLNAAENGLQTIARRLLGYVAPETKYGGPPNLKDDSLLYFYALVKQSEDDAEANQIFKYLAQYDGLYRTRSLQNLSEANIESDHEPYDSFSEDLESVSQQYRGRSESRQASLQFLKQRIRSGFLIEAMELTGREFKLGDAERLEIVNFIGKKIEASLVAAVKSVQLKGLSAFIEDPSFFTTYERLDELSNLAAQTALDIDLPELVSVILGLSDHSNKDVQKFKVYSQAKIALKHEKYNDAIDLATRHKSEPKFEKLILEASLKSDDFRQAKKVLSKRPADTERHKQEANIAWQNGDWKAAEIALVAVSEENPSDEVTNKILISSYVGDEALNYVDQRAPTTVVELDMLKKQLDRDISLVRGFLSDG